ncbi:MAG: flagellar accessory protein FlaH [Chloroflexi bacterium]|nr:flagellar accessory protein FlaH [Chloroflexota bacterium]
MGEKKVSDANLILTGVREIDEKLGGGIPAGSLVLVDGQPDAGKSVLCQHLVYGALHSPGNAIVYYTTENTVKSLISQMDSLSLYTLDYFLTDRLRIYPVILRQDFRNAARPLHSLVENISRLDRKINMVIVDSVTLLMSHSDAVSTVDFFWACKGLCELGRSIILVAHSYSFEQETLSRASSLCDVHLRLRLEEVGTRLIKVLEVLKVRGANRPTGEIVSFEIEPKIGMRVIPFSRAKV